MHTMPLTLTWQDLLLRLGLTLLSGFLIGFNRGERRRPAGLRTTMLVCLAASLSMLQANALLGTAGKPPSSFIQLDLMRFPLGILSGMGFIGAGAIIRRGDAVIGVTTAATLWFVTVVGLCIGGGQIMLGLLALLLGLFILEVLKAVETKFLYNRDGVFTIVTEDSGPTDADITSLVTSFNCKVSAKEVVYLRRPARTKLRIHVHWRGNDQTQPPDFVTTLANKPGVLKLQWKTA